MATQAAKEMIISRLVKRPFHRGLNQIVGIFHRIRLNPRKPAQAR